MAKKGLLESIVSSMLGEGSASTGDFLDTIEDALSDLTGNGDSSDGLLKGIGSALAGLTGTENPEPQASASSRKKLTPKKTAATAKSTTARKAATAAKSTTTKKTATAAKSTTAKKTSSTKAASGKKTLKGTNP